MLNMLVQWIDDQQTMHPLIDTSNKAQCNYHFNHTQCHEKIALICKEHLKSVSIII